MERFYKLLVACHFLSIYSKTYFCDEIISASWRFFFLSLEISRIGMNIRHIIFCYCTIYFSFFSCLFISIFMLNFFLVLILYHFFLYFSYLDIFWLYEYWYWLWIYEMFIFIFYYLFLRWWGWPSYQRMDILTRIRECSFRKCNRLLGLWTGQIFKYLVTKIRN